MRDTIPVDSDRERFITLHSFLLGGKRISVKGDSDGKPTETLPAISVMRSVSGHLVTGTYPYSLDLSS